MAGPKTHEQFTRNIERKPDLETPHSERKPPKPDRGVRDSEFPVSEQGMNQESEHNKHNHPRKGA